MDRRPHAVVFVILLPIAFRGAYHYYKDSARPEPVHTVTYLPAAVLLILVIWLWRMRLIRELRRDTPA